MKILRLKFFSGAEENRTWEEILGINSSINWIVESINKNSHYRNDRSKQFSLGSLTTKRRIKDLEISIKNGNIYNDEYGDENTHIITGFSDNRTSLAYSKDINGVDRLTYRISKPRKLPDGTWEGIITLAGCLGHTYFGKDYLEKDPRKKRVNKLKVSRYRNYYNVESSESVSSELKIKVQNAKKTSTDIPEVTIEKGRISSTTIKDPGITNKLEKQTYRIKRITPNEDSVFRYVSNS